MDAILTLKYNRPTVSIIFPERIGRYGKSFGTFWYKGEYPVANLKGSTSRRQTVLLMKYPYHMPAREEHVGQSLALALTTFEAMMVHDRNEMSVSISGEQYGELKQYIRKDIHISPKDGSLWPEFWLLA